MIAPEALRRADGSIFRSENLPCGCSLQANWYFIVPDFVWDFIGYRG